MAARMTTPHQLTTRAARNGKASGKQQVEPARRRDRLSPSYRTVAFLVLPFVSSVTRQKWSGWEYLPQEGGFVAAPNHISYFDPFSVAHFLYKGGCVPYFLGKEELFRVPVIGPLLVASGQVPVYRKTGRAVDAYRAAVEGVDAGKCVVVFPEGTLTRDPDLWPMVGKTGAARIALQTRKPVIPIAHWGDQRIIPTYGKGIHLLARHTISVTAGPPVDLDDLYERPLDAVTLKEATDRIMARVTGLLEGLRDEVAPTVRHDPKRMGQPDIGNFKKGRR
jgi:1-acyl-sn-glycerol-3-phosphate acyltransferase